MDFAAIFLPLCEKFSRVSDECSKESKFDFVGLLIPQDLIENKRFDPSQVKVLLKGEPSEIHFCDILLVFVSI